MHDSLIMHTRVKECVVFRSQKGQGGSYIDAIAINQCCPSDDDKTQYDVASIIDGNLSFANRLIYLKLSIFGTSYSLCKKIINCKKY